jgi:aspartate aminotransferase, mitochondrial
MIQGIGSMKEGDVILLQTCAHNPSGIDPTEEQWKKISEAIRKQGVLTLFDFAYQGFASGDIDRDAFPIRQFAADGNEMLVCQSFSKNFGIYSTRTGTLSITTASVEESDNLLSQLKILIRPMYSNPPAYGAKLVSYILEDAEREKVWRDEVNLMAKRVIRVRKELVDDLRIAGSLHNWDHIVKQIGMFCYSGLSPQQVTPLDECCSSLISFELSDCAEDGLGKIHMKKLIDVTFHFPLGGSFAEGLLHIYDSRWANGDV